MPDVNGSGGDGSATKKPKAKDAIEQAMQEAVASVEAREKGSTPPEEAGVAVISTFARGVSGSLLVKVSVARSVPPSTGA